MVYIGSHLVAICLFLSKASLVITWPTLVVIYPILLPATGSGCHLLYPIVYRLPMLPTGLLGCNLPNLIATYPCCHLTYLSCNLPYLISSYPGCHEPYRITSFLRYHLSYLVQSTLNLIASYPGCNLPYLITSCHWPTCCNLTYLVASYPGCHLPFLQCIKAPSDWTLQELCPLFTEKKGKGKRNNVQ
jgi:hypothetical protein